MSGRFASRSLFSPVRSLGLLLLLGTTVFLSTCNWFGSAPPVPANLTVRNPTLTSLTITWSASSGAETYQLFRAASSSGPFSLKVYPSNATTYTNTGLKSETAYFYEVRAVNTAGTSAKSAPQSGTTLGNPPATPTGLTVETATETSLTVSWNASTGATSYQVFRDANSGGSFTTKVYDGTGVSFTDGSLSSGVTYYYEVQATNQSGSSAKSIWQAGTTAVEPAPTGLTVGSPTFTSLTVSWNQASGATGYRVVRDTNVGGTFATQAYNGTDTQFTDTSLASGDTYYYRVQSTTGSSMSALSDPVSGTVSLSPIMPISAAGSFSYSLSLSSHKDVYFVFSNPTTTSANSRPTVSPASNISGSGSRGVSPAPAHGIGLKDRFPPFKFNPASSASSPSAGSRAVAPPKPSYDKQLETATFMDLDSGGYQINIPATCRMVVSNVPVASGAPRTLNIWVADDCWTGTGNPTTMHYLVTPEMVQAVANAFLDAQGSGNDIYHWVTNIFGPEYGQIPPSNAYYSFLIPESDEITILLYDIDFDRSTNGGTLGYFFAKDLFNTTGPPYYSNQREMFYLDAILLATPDDGKAADWKLTDYWPSQMISTLAHEFQHMIHFYQKTILQTNMVETDTWINEMCSMLTEDMVADKLHVPGPRGVAWNDGTAGSAGNQDGEIAGSWGYNQNNGVSLIDWGGGPNPTIDEILHSYAIAYAFGAYLGRNFGGAKLFHDIVYNADTDSKAIDDALAAGGYSETFASVFQKWGVADLLSDSTSAPAGYQYNLGGYATSSVSGTTYDLGSIDLFNYVPAPTIWTGSAAGSANQLDTSNLLYEAGSGYYGYHAWNVQLPAGVVLTVVLK